MNEQPFTTHLIELRTCLIRGVVCFFLVFLVLFHWSGTIYHILAQPLLKALPVGINMIATDVTAPFFVPIKVTMLVAFLISLPNSLYQAWNFVAPGLYAHEKRLILPLVVSSVALFILGMAFAYFLVFPLIFHFLSAVTPEGVSMTTDIDKYLSFVLGMFLAFGCTFEIPVVVIMLTRLGMVSIDKLRQGRPYIIVGSFVVAAVVTPPDVFSQVMMALPMWLLYEAGIVLSIILNRKLN